MDNLFWLLYLGDVVESLHAVFSVIGGLSLGLGLFAALIFALMYYRASTEPPDDKKAQRLKNLSLSQYGKVTKSILIGIICLFLSAFTPSKQTIYIYVGASATIDLANKAVDSNLGKKTLKLLENKIDKALEEEMPETPEKE